MTESKATSSGGRDLPPPDSERDLALGAALRSALDPRGEAAFVSRVLADLDAPRPAPTLWDCLAGWARRGIPAVLGVTALAVVLLNLRPAPPANLEDVLAGGESDMAASMLSGSMAPGSGVLFEEPTDR